MNKGINMDEKQFQKKPLRTAANRMKDIYNTYVKNDEGRQMGIYLANEEKIQANKEDEKVNLEEIKMEDSPEDMNDNSQNQASNQVDESIILELTEKINQLEKEKEDLKEQVIRKTAEVENIRRRSIKEKQEMIDYANEKLLIRFLAILDDLNNAINAANQSNDYNSLLQGIEMIYNKAVKLFEESGVTQIPDCAGTEFDVNLHEALAMLASNLPENYIIQEIQAGYMMFGKVLRHTKVITSSGIANNE
jgi:molecular chaperone GrpE